MNPSDDAPEPMWRSPTAPGEYGTLNSDFTPSTVREPELNPKMSIKLCHSPSAMNW